MLSAEDLSAILDDLEDLCARLPEGVNFHPVLEIHREFANEEATYIKFSCYDHRYILTIVRKGIARTMRVSTREELFERLFPGYMSEYTEEYEGEE